MSVSLLRALIREEIKKLIQDDAIFYNHDDFALKQTRDTPGIEEEFDEPGDDYPCCVEDYEEIALERRATHMINKDS